MLEFEVFEIKQISASIIRVSYTSIPLLSNDIQTNDALNIINYTLTGPQEVRVVLSAPVSGDPYSVDLYLNGNLDADNTWLFSVSQNIQDVLQQSLSGETDFSFESKDFLLNKITGGAVTETAEQVLRRFINPKLKGKVWNALIAALATGEQANWDNAALAFDQLYLMSASGKYLRQRGSDYGVGDPKNVGLSDDLYRKYVNQIINRQLTLNALNELIEVFYGVDGTHASIISTISENFSINDGDDLLLKVNNSDAVSIVFSDDDFQDISSVSAMELSLVFNINFDLLFINALAVPYLDPETGLIYIKLISTEIGTKSSIEVIGGLAQKVFRFDTLIDAYSGADPLPTWNITLIPETNRVRFTTTTDPTQINLNQVHINDYVLITGAEFNSANRGSFNILDISIVYPLAQYFEIENFDGLAQAGIVQLNENNVMFFRPTEKTIYSVSNLTAAFAAQVDGEIDVILPATPLAIAREEFSGAYFQDYEKYELSSGSRGFSLYDEDTPSVLTLASPVSFSLAPHNTQIKNIFSSYTKPATVSGDPVGPPMTVDSSSVSIWSELADIPNEYADGTATVLDDGVVVLAGGTDPSLGAATRYSNKYSVFTFDGTSEYTWDSGDMTGRRYGHAASAVFDDTQVFITGGSTNPTTLSITTTELVYPFLGTSVAKAAMSQGRKNHAQVTLADGSVLVCGGTNAAGTQLTSVEVYNPVANTWTTKASMGLARIGHVAILLNNGKVFVCGNIVTGSPTTEIYDPVANTWSFSGNRSYFSISSKNQIIKLQDGRILSVGAYGYTLGHPSDELISQYISEIYNPETGFWGRGPRMVREGFDDDPLYASDLAVASFYLEDLKVERIVAIQRAYTDSVDTVPVQYLDMPRFEQISHMPKNAVDFKWRRGPDIGFPEMFGLFMFIKSKNNSMLLAGALEDGGSAAIGLSKLYIANADEWGVANFDKIELNSELISSTSLEVQDLSRRVPSAGFDVSDTEVLFVEAEDSDGIAGPYMWDTTSYGIVISDPETALTEPLYQGLSYTEIEVTSTAGFPESGYLVFNFGHDNKFNSNENLVYPVRYDFVLSSTKIAIDAAFIFPSIVTVGSSVSYVSQLTAYDPEDANILGSIYITDTPAGRIAAQNAVDRIVAGGTKVNYIIKYPGDIGLGAAGFPVSDSDKLSDIVDIYGDPSGDLNDS